MNRWCLILLSAVIIAGFARGEEGDDPFYPKIVDPYRPEHTDKNSKDSKSDEGVKIRRRPQPRGEDQNDRPPPPPSREQIFKHLDTNGDGVISREEFMSADMPPPPPPPCRPAPEEFFKQIDKNGDGKLSLEEFRNAPRPPPPPGVRFDHLPTPDEMFARLDVNEDGSLSLEEFKRGRLPPPPPRPERNDAGREFKRPAPPTQKPASRSHDDGDKSEF